MYLCIIKVKQSELNEKRFVIDIDRKKKKKERLKNHNNDTERKKKQ